MSGGIQNIREAVHARRSALIILARNADVRPDLLDSFARGNVDLPPAALAALVREIWQYIEYDPVHDILQQVPQPPARSVGVLPKLEMKLPRYQYGPSQRPGPQPVDPAPPKPKRPGWLGVWE